MPKAASSFLQVNFAEVYDNYLGSVPKSNLGYNGNKKGISLTYDEKLIEALVKYSDYEFEVWIENFYFDFDESIDYVLSSEFFMSPYYCVVSFSKKIDRLERVLGGQEYQFIAILRPLQTFAQSLYADYPYHPSRLEGETKIYTFDEWVQLDLASKESFIKYVVESIKFISSRDGLFFEFADVIQVRRDFKNWLEQFPKEVLDQFVQSNAVNSRVGHSYHMVMMLAHNIKNYFPRFIRKSFSGITRDMALIVSKMYKPKVNYSLSRETEELLAKYQHDIQNLIE